jgi:sarcosine oxidase subunit beta
MKIVVIGGGIAGSFTAYFLHRQGASVTLVSEKPRYPGVGLVLSILLPSPYDVSLAARSLDIYMELGREEGAGRIIHPFPVYEVFPRDARIPSRLIEEWRRIMGEVEILDAAEARLETGLRISDEEWVLRGGYDYVVSVQRIIRWIHGSLGAIHASARLRRDPSGKVDVVFRNNRIRPDAIVLAAGPWNKSLASSIGLELPLATYGARALLMLGPRKLSTISLSDNVLSFYSRPTDKPLANMLGAYLAGDGNVPGAKPGSPKPKDKKYARSIAGAVKHRAGGTPLILGSGWGVLEIGLDHFPIAGLADPAIPLYVIGGLDGYGATIGPGLAEKLAAMIMKGGEELGLPCHDIARFRDRSRVEGFSLDWEPFLLYPKPPPTVDKKCVALE